MECISCFEEINDLVYYRDKEEGEWKNSPYCFICIDYLLKNQWKNYTEEVKNETCKRTLIRLIKIGPPIYLREPVGLPCENENNEVYELKINDKIISAKLEYILDEKNFKKYIDVLEELTKILK